LNRPESCGSYESAWSEYTLPTEASIVSDSYVEEIRAVGCGYYRGVATIHGFHKLLDDLLEFGIQGMMHGLSPCQGCRHENKD